MSKNWDKAVPSVDIWRECLRVLKPGAFAFVMCTPRQDCLARMIVNLDDAGFETGYSSLYHAFAQGFTKGMNMSKAIDKRLGQHREAIGISPHSAQRTETSFHGAEYKKGWTTKGEGERYLTTPATPEAQALDGSYSGAQFKPALEVIIVAQKPDTRKHKRSDVYTLLGAKYDYWYTAHTIVTKDNKAKLEKKWDTAFEEGDVIERRLALVPKLDDEVLVNRERVLWSRAYKNSDLASTITQALDGGKAVTWMDDARIPTTEDRAIGKANWGGPKKKLAFMGESETVDRLPPADSRFPANLLVSDDSLNTGQDFNQGGSIKDAGPRHNVVYGKDDRDRGNWIAYADSGSFSKYFSLDQWWAEKLKELPESVQRTFPFLICPKAGKKEKNLGCEGLEGYMHQGGARTYDDVCANCGNKLFGDLPYRCDCGDKVTKKRKTKGNYHPTVKSVKLMSYLVTLGSRPGDLILDPFAGTCTTAMAAKMLGRDWVMIEISEEWCQIGKRRVEATVARLI